MNSWWAGVVHTLPTPAHLHVLPHPKISIGVNAPCGMALFSQAIFLFFTCVQLTHCWQICSYQFSACIGAAISRWAHEFKCRENKGMEGTHATRLRYDAGLLAQNELFCIQLKPLALAHTVSSILLGVCAATKCCVFFWHWKIANRRYYLPHYFFFGTSHWTCFARLCSSPCSCFG